MSSVMGERIKLTIFGESHGPSIGVVIDGLPAGLKLDWDLIEPARIPWLPTGRKAMPSAWKAACLKVGPRAWPCAPGSPTATSIPRITAC